MPSYLRSRKLTLLAALLCLALPLAAQMQTGSQQRKPATGSSAGSTDPTLSSTSTPITVTGQVLNVVSGMPVPRALVQINERAMLTDHEGKFRFDQFDTSSFGMLRSTVTVTVIKPGFSSIDRNQMITQQIRSDQLGSLITLRLYPEALLTGTLTAPDGTPLEHVQIMAQRLMWNDAGSIWQPVGQHQTNSRGEFRIPVPGGDYRIETMFQPRMQGTSKSVLPLEYPGKSSSETLETVHLTSGAEQRLELHAELAPTYPVRLTVDPPLERGSPSILVHSNSGATFPAMVRRGPDGSVGSMDLPSGTYTLIATWNLGSDGAQYGETSVTVTGQNNPEAVLHMAPMSPIPIELIVDRSGGTTSGSSNTTSDNPPTVQQLGLMLASTGTNFGFMGFLGGRGQVGLTAGPNQTGSFRASPGTYRLTSHGFGQWYIRSATYGGTNLLTDEFTVAQGSGSAPIVLTVSNQTGSLTGAVTLAGAPAQAWVYLIPTGPTLTQVYPMRSSYDGSFNFANLPPGGYRAVAFEQMHQDNYRDPKVLDRYATHVHTVIISAGNKATLDVDTVPEAEVAP